MGEVGEATLSKHSRVPSAESLVPEILGKRFWKAPSSRGGWWVPAAGSRPYNPTTCDGPAGKVKWNMLIVVCQSAAAKQFGSFPQTGEATEFVNGRVRLWGWLSLFLDWITARGRG